MVKFRSSFAEENISFKDTLLMKCKQTRFPHVYLAYLRLFVIVVACAASPKPILSKHGTVKTISHRQPSSSILDLNDTHRNAGLISILPHLKRHFSASEACPSINGAKEDEELTGWGYFCHAVCASVLPHLMILSIVINNMP